MSGVSRSVKVVLEADVAKYATSMARAGKAADDTAKASERAGKAAERAGERTGRAGKQAQDGNEKSRQSSEQDTQAKERQAAAADKLGGALQKVGIVGVAALGASAKAAMDWESAWAGVTKTVDGTPAQMAAMEQGLRNMAKTLPATHEELAGVAEAAGQLGVARQDILGFTKTMVDLSVSTNLTADDAATKIAQISNVMGTMKREGAEGVSRFGATLVALGNAGASTESEILDMSQRIAGAGAIAGASEVDVLSLANTLASMGVRAELGGGVATRAILKMNSAVRAGGEDLDAWAKVAGVSAQEFSKTFGDSPIKALALVSAGIDKVNKSGGDVTATLADLGLKGTENAQVMLALAASGNLLSDSLSLGAKSWQENTALVAEATKRYETTESKVKVAWNNIKDAAIDAGAVLLPVVATIGQGVAGVAKAFGDLPGPVQSAITILGGVAAVGALAVGTGIKLVGAYRDAKQVFADLNVSGGKARGVLGGVGKAAGVATIGIAALNAVARTGNAIFGKQASTASQYEQGLLSLAKGTKQLDDIFRDGGLGTQINGVGDAIKRMADKDAFDDFNIWLGDAVGSGSKMNTLRDNINGVDAAMAKMAGNGNAKAAAESFKTMASEAEKQGVNVSKLVDMFPTYRDAVLDVLNANGQTNVTQEQLAQAMLNGVTATQAVTGAMQGVAGATETSTKLTEEQVKQLEDLGITLQGRISDLGKFVEALSAAGLANLSTRDAVRNYKASLDEITKAITDNGTSLDINTEKGRSNQAALDGVASSGLAVVDSMAKQKDSYGQNVYSQEQVQAALGQTYTDLVNNAARFVGTGKAAQDMARDILKVPKDVNIKTWMSDYARNLAQQTAGAVNSIPNYKNIQVNVIGAAAAAASLAALGAAGAGSAVAIMAATQKRAAGGPIWGPGPKGVDSVPAILAPGEHVLTAKEVDLMGGQQGVYRFRANLRSGPGVQAFAAGGAVAPTGRTVAARDYRSPSIVIPTLAGPGGGPSFTYIGKDGDTMSDFFDRARFEARKMARSAR
ncbi:phage tail tape measure protein [Arthrobacter woluwensis]|uniref:phage tail tape measure protein n=1 Tax=Arthrobacter woluwensis TaxID=156980 RepID=UPI000D13249D|nr:phage tail tape measure protein [Arthrobacter woluwensis]PSS42899.1 phage tail tape measure protein [Arthrobacter woluwensis]